MKEAETPILSRLSRRHFLALAGAVAGGVSTTYLLISKDTETQTATTGNVRSFDLPGNPNHNPGFQAQDIADEGVLLWTNEARSHFRAYRLNTPGRAVWRLCDGTRNLQEVSQEYEKRLGRPAQESGDFLQELVRAGIVVTGSHIIASTDFVLPDPGRSYHVRLSDEDPGVG